jgi:hypothetical protein
VESFGNWGVRDRRLVVSSKTANARNVSRARIVKRRCYSSAYRASL